MGPCRRCQQNVCGDCLCSAQGPTRRSARVAAVDVGAIGRQVALPLAALGVSQLTLIDQDTVNVENLALQGYWPEDLGEPKVLATANLCRRIQLGLVVHPFAERYKRSNVDRYDRPGEIIVFACVDRMETRRILWESLGRKSDQFLDRRMSGEVLRVLAAQSSDIVDGYAQSLFPHAEVQVGACTTRSTIYTASIAAGLLIQQFTRWLSRLPLEPDMTLNLLAMELTLDVQRSAA